MKFLDKLNKFAEKLVTSVEETANDVSKTYKDKGINGFVEKAADNLDNLSAKTKDYYSNIAQTNKEILKSNTSKSLEDKIVTVAAVVVNTAQTIVQDAVKTVVKTDEAPAETTQKTTQETTTNAKEETVVKTQKKVTPLSEQLSDGEIASLNATPLDIVLENIGAKKVERTNDRWTTADGSTIMVVQDKWHCFTNAAKGQGAISFVKFALNNEQDSSLADKYEDNLLNNEALRLLQSYHNDANYQSRVSTWIKNEHEFSQKKLGLITANDLTDIVEEVNNPVKKVSKPRVRKPKLQAIDTTDKESVDTQEPVVKATPTRKRKMN